MKSHTLSILIALSIFAGTACHLETRPVAAPIAPTPVASEPVEIEFGCEEACADLLEDSLTSDTATCLEVCYAEPAEVVGHSGAM